MATFQNGQMVESTANAQGMVRGQLFRVLGSETKFTPFGGFVTWFLVSETGAVLAVGNGPFVLKEWEPPFAPVEVAFRRPGKRWSRKVVKSAAEMVRLMERLEEEAAEVRFPE